MDEIPAIQTARLMLRPLRAADAVIIHRIYKTDGGLKYFPIPTPPPLDKVERFIAGQQEQWKRYGYGNWGILPNGEDEIIGWVGLQFLPELDETQVGFLLDKPIWGKGYATEAARASIQFGFDQLDFNQLIALVHPENTASRRVLDKCGMTYIETIRLWGMDIMRHLTEKMCKTIPITIF
jgi:ribosomal-protein-alanine N-acetyltransferase